MKNLGLLLIISLSLLLANCQDEIKEYQGKEIVTIEFTSIDYMGGSQKNVTFNFIENTVIVVEEYPYLDVTLAQEYEINPELYKTLFDRLYTYGFFALDALYEEEAIDGGEETITVTYTDNETFTSKKINASNGIEEKIGIAFYDFIGEELVGYVPSSYKNPQVFNIYLVKRISTSTSFVSYPVKLTNYTWHSKIVEGISVVDAIEDFSPIIIADGENLFCVDTENSENKFSKIIINSFDLDGNNQKTIINTGNFKQKEFVLEPNRIYQMICTYQYGTVETIFYTVEALYETKPI